MGQSRVAHLEALAEFDKLRHLLIHITLNQSLSPLRQTVSLVSYKVAEGRKWISRRLENKDQQRLNIMYIYI